MDIRSRVQTLHGGACGVPWGCIGTVINSFVSEVNNQDLVKVKMDNGRGTHIFVAHEEVEYLQPWRHKKITFQKVHGREVQLR
jgi:hypothetical protein